MAKFESVPALDHVPVPTAEGRQIFMNNSMLSQGELELILRRTVALVKARTRCQCWVSVEMLLSLAGELQPYVWAIVPCRLHMADTALPTTSALARNIESEAILQITQYAILHRQSA